MTTTATLPTFFVLIGNNTYYYVFFLYKIVSSRTTPLPTRFLHSQLVQAGQQHQQNKLLLQFFSEGVGYQDSFSTSIAVLAAYIQLHCLCCERADLVVLCCGYSVERCIIVFNFKCGIVYSYLYLNCGLHTPIAVTSELHFIKYCAKYRCKKLSILGC